MTNPFLNRLNTIYRGSRVLIPFFSDLNTWYKRIVGNIFNESINNLPARFLPRVASFNGTDDGIQFTPITIIRTADTSLIFLVKRIAIGGADYILGSSTTNSFKFVFLNPDGRVILETNTNDDQAISDIVINNTNWNKVEIRINNSVVSVKINDISIGMIDDSITDDITLDRIAELASIFTACKLAYFKILNNTTGVYILNMTLSGQGSHEYDISTNGNHGTINGTGTHYDFDINGSTRPNDVGYSIWRKALNPDIQVQFDINGAAISLTAGVNIPAGYSFERDVPAGGSNHNIYKSLVDMEYGSLLQCDTAGIAYATQNEAYGLVFDGIVMKKLESSKIIIPFINQNILSSPDNVGYLIYVSNSESIQLYKDDSALFLTANDYLNIETNYRFLVWRNETVNEFVTGAEGTFAVYIQGKTKAITTTKYDIPNTNEMELVDVSGGTGTNPITDNTYTTSLFQVIDNDAGDQVSKIEVNGKYISPYDFTVSTGAYSIIDNAKNAIFNRTNATRQTATSRASEFYNSDYPFIYHIDEISDPRVYDTFFEDDYKNRVFGKVKLLGTEIIRLDELPNYANKKENGDLLKVTNYCGITGIYINVPAAINDGNTVAWYDSQLLSTISKDGSNLVARWNDRLGSGHDLIQATALDKPTWSADGILFLGVREFMKTVGFTLNQPTFIYAVLKQITWSLSDAIWDGDTQYTGALLQSVTTPNVRLRADGSTLLNTNMTLDTYKIVRALYNGVSSTLQINETTKTTGDCGSNNFGGFILGANTIGFGWSHIQVKEIILRKIADSAGDEQDIYDYLAAKYGI